VVAPGGKGKTHLLREVHRRTGAPLLNSSLELSRRLLDLTAQQRALSLRRLKVFRLEAVRAGFKKAWQERDYATIITVARKIPETILQEDPKLLM